MPLDKTTILNAVKEAKEKSGKKKFNQTVDLILNIQEIDMKAPEGKIQEVVELPHATGKPNKVCVIASGELAFKARKANAERVVEKAELEGLAGKKKELRKLAGEYDIFISEASFDAACWQNFGSSFGSEGKNACSSFA